MGIYEQAKQNMKLYFDLDGTLLDSHDRLYHLFQHLIPESRLTFDDYWLFKRRQIDHRLILKEHFGYSEDKIDFFTKKWMEKIESREWLRFDKPFSGVTELLQQLSKDCNLYIVTARQSETIAAEQIEELGWNKILKDIFVTCQETEKQDLILEHTKPEKEDWFIGDTGKDIQTGKALGIRTIGVLSGFRDRQSLEKYKPDIILDSVLNITFRQLL
jgi:phosphoglycolate phosphatase